METLNFIDTGITKITFKEDQNLLIIKASKNAEVDLEEAKKCFEAYSSLGIGPENKVLQLVDAREYYSITKEARDYVGKVSNDYFIAAAVVSNSVAIKLIVNLFNKIYNLSMPIKMFGDIEKAYEWLQSHQ